VNGEFKKAEKSEPDEMVRRVNWQPSTL